MLFAVTMMERVGIAGSLLSLGAIDFGLVVDSSVVMVENCVRRLAHDRTTRSQLDVVREAAIEVRKPTMFGELIIMIVYLPILTLEGIEGKLFRRRQPGPVQVHSLCGPMSVTRWTYREEGVRNGPTCAPMESAAGLIERATPRWRRRSRASTPITLRAPCTTNW